jgi:hypothetical protein
MAEKLTIAYKRPIKPVYIHKADRFHRRCEQGSMSRLEYPVVVEPLPTEEGGAVSLRLSLISLAA